MRITPISKTDTLYFKAIGILLIVFHNYLHWVQPRFGENEFHFAKGYIESFYKNLVATPLESINLLFSFFGHYGVQVFVFISAVGLTYSMLQKPTRYRAYLAHRFKSIYAMLIVAVVFYFFSHIVIDQHLLTATEWRKWLWKFLLVHTLIPKESLSLSGPYWFFGLIIQLYILFPLLLRIIQKFNVKGFISICLFSYICTYLVLFVRPMPIGVEWFANSIAHLPEFAFGIWIVLNPHKRIAPAVFVAAFVFLLLGNLFKVFFPITFLSVTLVLYAIITQCKRFFDGNIKISNVIQQIGTLSMAIFIVHGVFRVHFIALFSNSWYEKLIGAALFFIAIYAVAVVADKFYQWIYNRILTRKHNTHTHKISQ